MDFLTRLKKWLQSLSLPLEPDNNSIYTPPVTPDIYQEVKHAITMNIDTLTTWDTAENCRHNVRVLADLEGLTVEQKNLMSQVIHCESGYHTHAKHPNLMNGKQVSCDYGICQWNDKYHGAEITPDEAENNPEKAVRLMCQYVKSGRIKQWVCFSAGLYKKYQP